MDKTDIIVFLLFAGTIAYHLKCLKDLIIPTRKKIGEIMVLMAGVIVILGITHLKAKVWIHYLLGILGAILLVLSIFRAGITSKGISYTRSFYGFLVSWDKLKSVQVYLDDDVKVSFSGHGYTTLYFRKDDYNKILSLLREHLSMDSVTII